MVVLHICSDFCYTKVHYHLIQEISKLGVEQIVFTYMRDKSLVGKNSFSAENVRFIYCPVLKPYHRAVFHLKIDTVYDSLKKNVDLSTVDLIHCSTLFSDGGVALKAFKEFGVPYVSAVRSTDVDNFMKIAPHTWLTGRTVAKNAKKLIFITENLKNKFFSHVMVKGLTDYLIQSSIVQPNGIDEYWIENLNPKSHFNSFKILYVGSFIQRKNSVRLARAVLSLRSRYPSITMAFVGNGGSDEKRIVELCRRYPDCIFYLGVIKDKQKLLELYNKSAVFALPSVRETFGLVYFEALSQGCPVLYTKNDGIDGLVHSDVGVSISPRTKKSIAAGLISILDNYPSFPVSELVDFKLYRWSVIALMYLNLYQRVLSSSKSRGTFQEPRS